MPRKVSARDDFADLPDVKARLLDFQVRYEQYAKPFEWKFTRDDLKAPAEYVTELVSQSTWDCLFHVAQSCRQHASGRTTVEADRPGASGFADPRLTVRFSHSLPVEAEEGVSCPATG